MGNKFILEVEKFFIKHYTFGPKKDKLTVKWRFLLNEEVEVLYCSPNIVRVIKLRKMR